MTPLASRGPLMVGLCPEICIDIAVAPSLSVRPLVARHCGSPLSRSGFDHTLIVDTYRAAIVFAG
jgi:hypothetical protein